jgi:hypothetical protein
MKMVMDEDDGCWWMKMMDAGGQISITGIEVSRRRLR